MRPSREGLAGQPGPLCKPSPGRTSQLFEAVDAAGIAVFRIAFGGILLWETVQYLVGGQVRYLYVEPSFYFTFYGFDWISPWPGVGMYVHFVFLGVLAVLIMVGLLYRVAAVLFFFGFTYVFFLEQAYYLNHWYLVCLLSLLLIFIPADRAFSVRRWRHPGTPATLPAWTLWLLRAQLGIVYFYAGVAKLNGDWLRGEPARSICAALPAWAQGEGAVYLIGYGGLVFDLFVVPFLLWRKTRWLAFVAALAFHLSNALILPFRIGIFPWYMIAATTLFFEPDWPRRFIGGLRRLWTRSSTRTARDGRPAFVSDSLFVSTPAPRRRLVLVLGGAYLLIQVLLPLRHHLYPGDPGWTEEANNFAWRMMIYEKQLKGRFYARDPATGKTWEVMPAEYVSEFQLGVMAYRPDMILQFCHHVADDLRAKGLEKVEIRAYIKAAFNGRRFQTYVDPTVDLAAEPRSHRPKTWIKPLVVPFSEKKPVDKTSESRHGWAGFGVGSWVLSDEVLSQRTTTIRTRRRQQIDIVGGLRMVVTTNVSSDADDTKKYGGFVLGSTPEELDMRPLAARPLTRQKRLTIGSSEVPCVVDTYVMNDDDDPWQARLKVWRTSDVEIPYREAPDVKPRLLPKIGLTPDVVRMTIDVDDRMQGKQGSYEIQVEDPAVQVQVGNRTLTCVHESCKIVRRTGREKTLARVERWLSPEVPNHVVKTVVKISRGSEQAMLRWSVVDFGVSQSDG